MDSSAYSRYNMVVKALGVSYIRSNIRANRMSRSHRQSSGLLGNHKREQFTIPERERRSVLVAFCGMIENNVQDDLDSTPEVGDVERSR